MKSLQNRIFLFIVLLLMLVQAIALWTLFEGKNNQEILEINNRLNMAKTTFTEQFESRRDYLSAFAETAAQDFGIKQVFNDDTRSLLVALNNHRKRIDADLAMAIASDGMISAQLQVIPLSKSTSIKKQKIRQGSEINQAFRFTPWLESQQKSHLYVLNDALYQLSLSPLTVGSKTIGWLAFGFQIDQELAHHFLKLTQLQTDFIFKKDQEWVLIASSNNKAKVSFAQKIMEGKIPSQYIAVGHEITEFEGQQFGFAMYGLRANFVEVLQEQWWKVLILAFVTLLLSLTSAYWIAASITKPIKRLVKQAKLIASGDYQLTVSLNDKSELGQLADEFNVMQQAVLSREQAISHQANHDPLTNIPNRNPLKLNLNLLIKQQQGFSVFHLNISRLKDVNESLGHDVGDRLIKEVGKRLRQLTGVEFLSHLGADEFVIIFSTKTAPCIDEHMLKIQKVLDLNFEYQGINISLQTKIGIALYPEHSVDEDLLLQKADVALQYARKNNQPSQMYHSDLSINSIERLNLINDLKHAIEDGQLELFYQPKLSLQSGFTTHMEALVRWQHPKLGMIPPDNFIHIAEQTGQINALTHWVFINSLKQYKAWCEVGLNISVAVNISAENLKAPDFYDFICQSVDKYQVPAEKVTLEVTESAVVDDPEAAIAILQKFKDRGMRISIDDYGTGYSSLAQLKQLPVHELKIDKSFVQRLCDDEDDRIIVRSTIELAHNMGLSVVAEGIEDEFALNWLAKNKCELGQGYFISRPKPAQELTTWLLEKKVYAFE